MLLRYNRNITVLKYKILEMIFLWRRNYFCAAASHALLADLWGVNILSHLALTSQWRWCLPSDWAVRHSANWPCSTAGGIARSGAVPDSPPTVLFDCWSAAWYRHRKPLIAEDPPYASSCGPTSSQYNQRLPFLLFFLLLKIASSLKWKTAQLRIFNLC